MIIVVIAVAAAALGFGLGFASRYLRARRRNVASRGLDSLAILLVAAVMALHHDQAAVVIPYLAAFVLGRFMWPALPVRVPWGGRVEATRPPHARQTRPAANSCATSSDESARS